jgi:hypothetical protein
MNKEEMKRRVYEPPQARDLSEVGVSGDDPNGYCQAGPFPYYDCVTGPSYSLNCATGSSKDTSFCGVGSFHTYPGCKSGLVAATLCLSGSGQNF